ncbi:MAG: putative metal-dependent rane protease [Massilia sp.]|nr:putative metal-dependent rane protease [Massilia sp.]
MSTHTLDVAAVKPSRFKRIVFSAPVRIVLGVLAVGLTAALTFPAVKALVPLKDNRFVWPFLLAGALVLLVYRGYVKLMERRPLAELSVRGAPAEFGAGLLIGAAAVAATIGLLAATGSYRIAGFNPWSAAIAAPLAEMLFVAIFEEVLFRAVIFRIVERSLGSWPALAICALLFALAHLGDGVSALALANTALAGLMLSAAWMATRRLWLCIAIHAAWNYTLGAVFSIAVSGHPAKGLIIGQLSGPDWITGGVYGLEGSAWTALVMGALFVVLYRRARQTAVQ